MMKRLLTLLMALTMMLTMAACGKDEPEETPAPEGTEQTEVVEPAPETDEPAPEVVEPAAGVDLEGLKAQMIADCSISDYIDIALENAVNVYGLDASQVAAGAAFNATGEAAFPEEIVMIQAADEAAAAAVAAQLEARLATIAEQAASYDPTSLELAENCDVVVQGVYVGLFFSQHYDAMVSAFQAAVG